MSVLERDAMAFFDRAEPALGDADALLNAVTVACRALDALTEQSIMAVNEHVTLEQYRTLARLATSGPQSVGTLAERSGVHASTMTRMCDRLVARGLVTRSQSPLDHRAVMVQLTSAGATFVDQVKTRYSRKIEAATKGIDAALRAAAVFALRNLATVASEVLISRPIC